MREAIDGIRGVQASNNKLTDLSHGVSSKKPLTEQGRYYAMSKPKVSHQPEGTLAPDYPELEGIPHPYFKRVSAQVMTKLIAYLRINGGYQLVTTQDLGNCLYASFLRGTDCKREYATMHARRQIVMEVCKQPKFFYNYLKFSIASVYGQVRPDEQELARKEKKGKITGLQSGDYRLPGPFTFIEFLEHILEDGTWGDDHVLTLMSCIWQIKITILNAQTLGEIRIRHNTRLEDVDLIVVQIAGDHYMGCGKYDTFPQV